MPAGSGRSLPRRSEAFRCRRPPCRCMLRRNRRSSAAPACRPQCGRRRASPESAHCARTRCSSVQLRTVSPRSDPPPVGCCIRGSGKGRLRRVSAMRRKPSFPDDAVPRRSSLPRRGTGRARNAAPAIFRRIYCRRKALFRSVPGGIRRRLRPRLR